jgi:hypothetical protein
MAIQLTDIQKVALSISAVDAAGNPAPIETVSWVSSDTNILTVEASADGLSAVATTVGPLGTAQVQVTADVRMGVGEVNLQGILDVEVIASEAVALNIAAGVPESRL